MSRFPSLCLIFSSVKYSCWAGTLLHFTNTWSGTSLCYSKAFCAELVCLMPISHWTSSLSAPASFQLKLTCSKITNGSAFFHSSSLPLHRAVHSDAIHSPPFMPCDLEGVTLWQSSLQALLCFPSFNTLQNYLTVTEHGTQSSFLPSPYSYSACHDHRIIIE